MILWLRNKNNNNLFSLFLARHSPWHNKDKIKVSDTDDAQIGEKHYWIITLTSTESEDHDGIISIALFSSEGCASTRTLTRNCKDEEKNDKESELKCLK